MMESIAQIRLKCIELAHRHDLMPEMVIDRAAKYESYVTGEVEQSENHIRNGLTGRRGRPSRTKPAERLD